MVRRTENRQPVMFPLLRCRLGRARSLANQTDLAWVFPKFGVRTEQPDKGPVPENHLSPKARLPGPSTGIRRRDITHPYLLSSKLGGNPDLSTITQSRGAASQAVMMADLHQIRACCPLKLRVGKLAKRSESQEPHSVAAMERNGVGDRTRTDPCSRSVDGMYEILVQYIV